MWPTAHDSRVMAHGRWLIQSLRLKMYFNQKDHTEEEENAKGNQYAYIRPFFPDAAKKGHPARGLKRFLTDPGGYHIQYAWQRHTETWRRPLKSFGELTRFLKTKPVVMRN